MRNVLGIVVLLLLMLNNFIVFQIVDALFILFWCRKSLWGACRSWHFSNTFAYSQI